MDSIKIPIKAENLFNAIEVDSEDISNETIANFAERKKIVEKVISDIVANQKLTVKVNLKNVNVDNQKLERFIIELIPRLREIGATVDITNNNILSDSFIKEMGL